MAKPEETKKLSPDSNQDEENKNYIDSEATNILASLGDDEVETEENSQDKVKTPDENLSNPPDTSGDEDQNLDNLIDEVLDDDGKSKLDDPSETKTSKKSDDDKTDSKPDEAILAEKDAKITELQNEIKSLKEKVNSFGNVQNTIKELGFDGMNQSQLVSTMKELKQVAEDVKNTELLDVIEKVATGQFVIVDEEAPKRVSDYMPEGQEDDYDLYDAQNDPSSSSWKAREKWELDQDKRKQSKRDLLNKVNSYKQSTQSNGSDINEKFIESKKAMDKTMSEIEAFAKDEYEDGEEVYKEFRQQLKNLDPKIFKVAIAVTAKQMGKANKAMKKIKDNNGKVFPESHTARSLEDKDTEIFEVTKNQDEEYSKIFSDWENDPGVVR